MCIRDRYMGASEKRKDYISWDEYFMGIAMLSGMRSKDPNTQVGACIVEDVYKRQSIGDRCISLRPISLICIAMMERGWQAACSSFWIILIFGEIFIGYPIAYIGLPIYNDVR